MRDLLDMCGLQHAELVAIPASPGKILSKFDGTPLFDPSHYRSIVWDLQYSTVTFSYISYIVNKLAYFSSHPLIYIDILVV